MDRINIRDAIGSDADGLAQNCFTKNTVEEVRERLAFYNELGDDGHLFVADLDGEVIGTASVRSQNKEADINSVVVNLHYHGKGVARRLLEYVEQMANDRGISSLSIGAYSGSDAKKVYKKLGFVEESESDGITRLRKNII